MWLMMLACAAPLVIAAFVSSSGKQSLFWILPGFALMLIIHWLGMRHGGSQEQHPLPPPNKSSNASPKNEQPHSH